MAYVPDSLAGSAVPREPVFGPAAEARVLGPSVGADDRGQHAVAVGEGGAEAGGRAAGCDAADGERGLFAVGGEFAVEVDAAGAGAGAGIGAGAIRVGVGRGGVAGLGAHAAAEEGGVVDGGDAGVWRVWEI